MGNKIGLIGFGVVGQGYYEIANKDGKNLKPQHIAVKSKEKERPKGISFQYDLEALLADSEIGVELISETETAYFIAKKLLESGKTVISANKKLVAKHLPELLELERAHGGKFLYEAAVAASIPVLSNISTQYQGDQIEEIQGILNGSSNYILSKIQQENQNFEEALKQAQDNGYAEADPSFDINGSDVASKLCILAAHSYGIHLDEKSIPCIGIDHLQAEDFSLAKKVGGKIKLIALSSVKDGDVSASIFPTLVGPNHPLSQVENEYNAISILSKNIGLQNFQGKGAGGLATGSAVYSDLAKSSSGFKYTLVENGLKKQYAAPASSEHQFVITADSQLLEENFPYHQKYTFEGKDYVLGNFDSKLIEGIKEKIFTVGGSILAIDKNLSLEKIASHFEAQALELSEE
ncbi:homoserine dehydrogenase [Litoribacter alkaliphilus]|uniref:Homoserine dehydrogenase n=1 Tax=Litoribacter ruber TaxID=702568 RepID=A0AAP2G239_9BACT|nr:homoserine dehydrogenase [Litoribacter alkaliphilus]MBS9525172.1 homoserine dehydrogenase [Litoribacter alkaliphilus]